MNSPVALESTREVRDLVSIVSVVSTSTFSFKDFGFSSEVAMITLSGSHLSHFRQQCEAVSGWGSCTTSGVSTVSLISEID